MQILVVEEIIKFWKRKAENAGGRIARVQISRPPLINLDYAPEAIYPNIHIVNRKTIYTSHTYVWVHLKKNRKESFIEISALVLTTFIFEKFNNRVFLYGRI